MSDITYLRSTDPSAAHFINNFFERLGYGRPATRFDINGHITAAILDGELVGAAYAAVAASLADSFLQSGYGPDIEKALHFHSVEALAMAPGHQNQGHEEVVLDSIAGHARRDFGAEYLLARVDQADSALQSWFAGRGFDLCKPGHVLVVDGVPTLGPDGYRDAWQALTPRPRSTVRTARVAML